MLGASWVEYVHDELIRKIWTDIGHGDSAGIRDQGLLESAFGRPFQTVFGRDAYPTVIDKAVALFHSLVSNHPFHDGNKRTALLSLYHFLLANGYFAFLSNEEAYEIAKNTASYRKRGLSHDQAFQEIRELLVAHVRSFEAIRKLGGEGTPIFTVLYDPAVKFQRKIRQSSMNRLIP